MSFEVFGQLNWLAIIVSTVVYFALGGLWYSTAVFGKAWMSSIGWEPEPDLKPGMEFYVGPLASNFVASLATGLLVAATGTDTAGEAVTLGLVTGVGLAGAITFVTGFTDPLKKNAPVWIAVTGGYHVVGLLAASLIIALWP